MSCVQRADGTTQRAPRTTDPTTTATAAATTATGGTWASTGPTRERSSVSESLSSSKSASSSGASRSTIARASSVPRAAAPSRCSRSTCTLPPACGTAMLAQWQWRAYMFWSVGSVKPLQSADCRPHVLPLLHCSHEQLCSKPLEVWMGDDHTWAAAMLPSAGSTSPSSSSSLLLAALSSPAHTINPLVHACTL